MASESKKILPVIDKYLIGKIVEMKMNEPFGYATTAELMLTLGKGVNEALDIHNDLEKLANNMKNKQQQND